MVEMYLRDLPPEEQAEYRKTLPDFTLKIKERASRKTEQQFESASFHLRHAQPCLMQICFPQCFLLLMCTVAVVAITLKANHILR